MRRIYVRGTGQEDNIGDVILRRAFFDELSRAGELHILLGEASADFLSALDLRDSDVVYRDVDDWRRSAYRSVLRRDTWWVDKPGELLLEEDIYKGQRRLVPLILAVRARGGRALRLGIGQRKPNPAVIERFRRLYRLSSMVAWRDVDSREHFGLGEVMPDWGFLPGADSGSESRRRLVVSYRGDREPLSAETITAIREFASQESLTVTVITQVARDSARSKELHAQLGGDLVDWEVVAGHRAQEDRLRDIYLETAVALSDRLHVLIVAAAEGAVPVNLIAEPDTKVGRHFDAIGYHGMTVASADRTSKEILRDLAAQAARTDEVIARVSAARARIRDVARRALAIAS